MLRGVTTYYVGNYYEYREEQSGETTLETEVMYYHGGTGRFAMRTKTALTNDLHWIFSDHLQSSSVILDEAGGLVSRMDYTAFGEVRAETGTSPTDYQYTGQRSYTDDFGLMFYNARWYDPVTAHFVQADSLIPQPGNSADWNRYAYVLYNPINFNDPTGHSPGDLPGIRIHFMDHELVPSSGGDSGGNGSGGNQNQGGGNEFPLRGDCGLDDYAACALHYTQPKWPDGYSVDVELFMDMMFALLLRTWYRDHNKLQIYPVEVPVTRWNKLISGWDWYLLGSGDSPFFDGGDERTVIFPEGFFEGSYQLSEVNYIQIGMNGAASSMDVDQTVALAEWWKDSEYGDPLSAGTEKWLRMGHMYYSTYAAVVGPTLPSARGVSLHAWYKKVP